MELKLDDILTTIFIYVYIYIYINGLLSILMDEISMKFPGWLVYQRV